MGGVSKVPWRCQAADAREIQPLSDDAFTWGDTRHSLAVADCCYSPPDVVAFLWWIHPRFKAQGWCKGDACRVVVKHGFQPGGGHGFRRMTQTESPEKASQNDHGPVCQGAQLAELVVPTITGEGKPLSLASYPWILLFPLAGPTCGSSSRC